MKGFALLFLLVGAYAELDSACITGEFTANGRFTGQNIDMNYDQSALLTDGSGATQLRVQFFVPKRYTAQYEANAYAITFNRNMAASDADAVDPETRGVDQGTTDQSACFSNRYDNYTYCENMIDNLWTEEDNSDNPCISDVYATIPWADVMGTAFNAVEIKANGEFTEVFLKATVETWTHFSEGNVTWKELHKYEGVMTGANSLQNTDVDGAATNRQGIYRDDAGWAGQDFGNIILDDERYTLYQIPFVLRFPRTVVVETSFKVASPMTILTGLVSQDVIQLSLNPGVDGVFAVLEATLTTSVQYPYGVRSPTDNDAPMSVIVGDLNTAGAHADTVEFVEFDHESGCREGFDLSEVCEQTFKIRITPTSASPCSVQGDYTFEFWAKCVATDQTGENGCAIDDYVTDGDIEVQRVSNAYFTETITINHQPFCPLLVDEVRVVGDFRVFHDEIFKTEISPTSVFTNDILYYEAEYRTASASATSDFTDFDSNDFDGTSVGNDDIIDYVRATKVFMDVTIGLTSDGAETVGEAGSWDSDDWSGNTDFSPLGGPRVPGSQIAGDDVTLTQSSGNAAKYNIVLCDTTTIDAAEIQFEKDKPDDCFSSTNDVARDFLDFTKVIRSKEDIHSLEDNDIFENEVAFEMRMDERIIPLKPLATDGSFVAVTIESEVYYKGNRHPTRRLLQTEPSYNQQRQMHAMSTSYRVYGRDTLEKCTMDEAQVEGHLQLQLVFDDADSMPSVAGSVDWVQRLGYQLEGYLQTPDAVSIQRLDQCSDRECRTMYEVGRGEKRRRLEGKATHLNVYLKVTSSSTSSAGHILNSLQDQLINRRSDIHTRVSAFAKADISHMEVAGCGENVERISERQDGPSSLIKAGEGFESSAAMLSTLLASLVGLLALL